MKQENFYVVHGWMIKRLGLSGVEKEIYAIIYGFSQDGNSRFTGSLRYLQEWTGSGRSTVMRHLKTLLEKDLIIRHQIIQNQVTFNHYSVNLSAVQRDTGGFKMEPGGVQNDTGGSVKMEPHNILKKKEIIKGSGYNDTLFDGSFKVEETDGNLIDRIISEALEGGLDEEDITEFISYLDGKHLMIRDKSKISGMKQLVKNFQGCYSR